jgi:hypothetical protein
MIIVFLILFLNKVKRPFQPRSFGMNLNSIYNLFEIREKIHNLHTNRAVFACLEQECDKKLDVLSRNFCHRRPFPIQKMSNVMV